MTPILAVGVAALAALLVGCDKQDKTEEKPEPPQPRPDPIPENIPYQKKCLTALSDPACGFPAVKAAYYDYVGAVYGEMGKVSFDLKLTPEESVYVQGRFGEFNRDNILRYIRNAQDQSLKGIYSEIKSPFCVDSAHWKLMYGADPVFGEAILIGGVHRCFDTYKNVMEALSLENKIGSEPENWIFLIEEGESVTTARAKGRAVEDDELGLFIHIAERLGIPRENALLPLDSAKVIREMEKNGFHRKKLAVFLAFGHVNSRIMSDPNFRKQTDGLTHRHKSLVLYDLTANIGSNEASHHLLGEFVDTFGIPLEILQSEWANFLRVPPGMDKGAFYEKKLEQMEPVINRWVEVSNKLSAGHVRAVLEKHGKKKALIQVGYKHHPLISDVYQTVTEIPIDGN